MERHGAPRERNMLKKAGRFTHQMRFKLYGLFFGLVIGSGAQILSQGCITTGQ
jgi:hypothetical protein